MPKTDQRAGMLSRVDEDPGPQGGLVAVTHMATTSPGATRIELAFPFGQTPPKVRSGRFRMAEPTSTTSLGTPSAPRA